MVSGTRDVFLASGFHRDDRLLGSELGLSPRRARSALWKWTRLSPPKRSSAQPIFKGRFNEAAYQRALKELWTRLLIVAYGEVDEGAFPSLAIGATRLIFEDLWNEAKELTCEQALAQLRGSRAKTRLAFKYYSKLVASAPAS